MVTPAERIAELRKLSEKAATEQRRGETADFAAVGRSIRTEKDPLIRVEIIRALGRYPGPAADAILKAALSDADTHVRVVACEAWGKRGDAQAVKLLSEALRSDVDADVRLAAAKALGETKNPEAVAAAGRGPGRRRPGHAVSGRLVAQEGHRQGPGQRRGPLAAVRQRRAARADPVAGRAYPPLVLTDSDADSD